MKTFRFEPGLTFRDARRLMNELNHPDHKGHVARIVWLEGKSAGESLTFLWDPHAERFGHNIDKQPIESEIVANLINDIAVEVKVFLPHPVERTKGKS